jgi:hypothetical protein
MKSEPQEPQALSRIVGKQLSAVVFVLDYLQLQFDGPTLTLFTSVAVHSNDGGVVDDHAIGWRDALCGQITHVVRTVRLGDGELVVEFINGSAISASLRPEDYSSAEAVQFTDGKVIIII